MSCIYIMISYFILVMRHKPMLYFGCLLLNRPLY